MRMLPSLTVCISKIDINRHANAPRKLSNQDKVLLLSTTNIGAINIGVITCKIGKWLTNSKVPCLIYEAINYWSPEHSFYCISLGLFDPFFGYHLLQPSRTLLEFLLLKLNLKQ